MQFIAKPVLENKFWIVGVGNFGTLVFFDSIEDPLQ